MIIYSGLMWRLSPASLELFISVYSKCAGRLQFNNRLRVRASHASSGAERGIYRDC